MKTLSVIFTDPNGVELDVTGRIEDVSRLSEGTEEDVLDFTHGDMDFDLADQDGEVEKFFLGAEPNDEYTVKVYRETGKRRPKWDLVWAGLIDLPWSLKYDRKDKTASVQVFSHTKLLERGDADSIKRDEGTQTASITSGAAVMSSLTDTSMLQTGDTVSLVDSNNNEEGVIQSIDSATQITLEDDFTNTFAAAAFTLETPYYRDKSIAFLADLIFTEASIPDYEVSITERLAGYPVETKMSVDGIPDPSLAIRSIVEQLGQIVITYLSGNEQVADNPRDGWVDGSAKNNGNGDWRPYLTTEPTVLAAPSAKDEGLIAWDHTNGIYYDLEEIITADTPVPGTDRTQLYLRADGVQLVEVDTWTSALGLSGYDIAKLEYDDVNDFVWISYKRDAGAAHLKIYDAGGASLGSDIGDAGSLRCIRSLGFMAFLDYEGTTLTFYSLATATKTAIETINTITVPAGLIMWTLKHFGDHIVALYHTGSETRARVWTIDTNAKGVERWGQVADYRVSSLRSNFGNFLSVFSEATHDIMVGCAAGNDYFVLSPYFDGVVDYADFQGQSCASAMSELAMASAAMFTVDQYRVGFIKSRLGDPLQQVPDTLDTPLERKSRPVSDWYRGSVRITGEDPDGNEIDETAGAAGDSARRLSISGSLIFNESLALAIANIYYDLLGRVRSEEQVEIREGLRVIRPLDQVILDDVTYLVVSTESALGDERQELRLIEFAEAL